MCSHESRPCPGARCRCECMNCMFPIDEAASDFGEALAEYYRGERSTRPVVVLS